MLKSMKPSVSSVLALLASATLTSCLSPQDLGSTPQDASADPGCEAGTRFGADDLECGKTEAEIDLSVQTPTGTAALRGDITSLQPTRFGRSHAVDITVRNQGESPATALTFALRSQSTGAFSFETASTVEGITPCASTLAAGAECSARLIFAPQGAPYQSTNYRETLAIQYQNGKEARAMEFALEGTGEFCARRTRALELNHNPLRKAARLESDTIQLTQSFGLPSATAEGALQEVSAIRIPIARASAKTQLSGLILSLHVTDLSNPNRPAGAPLARIRLEQSELDALWNEALLQDNWLESTADRDQQGALGVPADIEFRLPEPLALLPGSRLVWTLETVGLASGGLLVGRHENLHGGDEAYAEGTAGLLSANGERFTAHPFFDFNFSIDTCVSPL